MNFKSILIYSCLLAAFSCADGPDEKPTLVNINIVKGKTEIPLLATPSAIGDINCVGVMVGYDSSSDTGTCTMSDNSTIGVSALGGLASFATSATVEVDGVFKNQNFTARAFGFNSSTGICPFIYPGFTPGSELSEAFVLGQLSTAIIDETVTSFTINATFDSSAQISSCDINVLGPFNTSTDPTDPTNTTSLPTFGDGSDGSITIASIISDITTDTSHLANSRVFMSNARIISVANDGKLLSLNTTPTYSAAHFAAGELIMWHVTAASSDISCDTNSNLTIGKYGFGIIESVDFSAKTITLVDQIMTDTSGINNTTIAESDTANPFCAMQIVRVPQFDNLDFTGGSIVDLLAPAFDFNAANGNFYGGLIVIKVNGTLTVSSTTQANLNVSEKGFQGGMTDFYQGQGIFGLGISTESPNGNGAGAGINAARGGGGAAGPTSSGGNGGNSSTNGGYGQSCAIDDCIIFGGGGGKGESGLAGNGGGAVILFARNITVSDSGGSLHTTVTGSAASAAADEGSGGGAGGESFVVANTITKHASGTIYFDASGADGSDHVSGTTLGGGGGAGGRAVTRFCSGVSSDITHDIFYGSGMEGGQDGSLGTDLKELDSTHTHCSE